MQDLGTPRKSDLMPAAPIGMMESEANKVEYPTLRLNGEQAELAGLNKCAFGDEYTVTLKLRAKRIGGDSYEMRGGEGKPPVEFDVIGADEVEEVESEQEDEGEDEKTESKPTPRQKPRVMGPKEAGFSSEPEESEDED